MSAGASLISVIPTLFLLGAIAIIFRNFTVNGRKMKFEQSSTHRTKSAAQKEAKRLREDDLLVRVTMKKKDGKKEFVVWKNNGDTSPIQRKSKVTKQDKVFDL